ncbi:MAG: efflux RND transporter periplasmic adaptor subunit [Alphaproteobacteria bacterium]
MSNTETQNTEDHHRPIDSVALRVFLTLLILACAGGLAYYFISNPDVSEKKGAADKPVVFVEAKAFSAGNYPITIEAMGRVTPAKKAVIKAQVSGRIQSVSDAFIPGGYFNAGQPIINIDPSDYELNIKVKEAGLRQAVASLKLEQGQQSIARDELKIIERTTGKKLSNSDLALRKPQMEQARANIASMQAALDIAKLDLERTTLSAPFNAIVTERNTDTGNVISMNDALATLVGTDEYWIEADIPVRSLMWLSFPKNDETDVKAVITQSDGQATREAALKNMTGMIDENSRLAKILISVPDPLLHGEEQKNGSFMLNLNDYVHVKIDGKTLQNSYKIPSQYIHDGQTLWLYKDGKLKIQPVQISYEDRIFVYVASGLDAQEHIITSDIITPVDGMDIQLRETAGTK